MSLSRIELRITPNANLTIGETMQLSCQAQDVKQLTTIRLLKGERLLSDGSNLYSVDSSLSQRADVRLERPVRPAWTGNELHANLSIHSIRLEDAGQYQCVVITPYGKAIRSLSFHVYLVRLHNLRFHFK